MLVTLLVIGGFLALRGVGRDQAEVEVPPVDYQDAVAAAADAGLALVHPRELPEGWTRHERGPRPATSRPPGRWGC